MPFAFPSVNIDIILPEIILVVAASVVLLIDAFFHGVRSRALAWLSLGGVVAAFLYAVNLWSLNGVPEYAFSNMVVRDNFGVFIKYIILAGTALVMLYSAGYLEKEDVSHGEYFGLMLFSAAGMMLLASSTDFITIFLGVETLSLAIYALTGFMRARPLSQEASLKYFLLSSFATAIMVYGVALVYGATGFTNLIGIADYVRNNFAGAGVLGGLNPMLIAGLGLVLAGLAFKLALVPFHIWTPDVYEGAPTTVTAFMAFGTKAAAFAALTRVFLSGFGDMRDEWSGAMWALAALTMFLGNVIAISQTNLKRLLAYSSIGHAGYILVGLLAGGPAGVSGIAFYLFAYTFMITGALGVVLYLERQGRNLTLEDYSGLATRYPVLAALMALFMFGLAGIPPTAGFVAKFTVFSAAIGAGYVGLAIIGVLTSVIAVYYYLRVIVYMYMRPAEGTMSPPMRYAEAGIALAIAAAATLILGVFPTPVLSLLRNVILPGT